MMMKEENGKKLKTKDSFNLPSIGELVLVSQKIKKFRSHGKTNWIVSNNESVEPYIYLGWSIVYDGSYKYNYYKSYDRNEYLDSQDFIRTGSHRVAVIQCIMSNGQFKRHEYAPIDQVQTIPSKLTRE